MTERWYRLIQGIYLIFALYFEQDMMIYVFMGVLGFEAITNLRLPIIVNKISQASQQGDLEYNDCTTFSIESERLLRLIVVAFLLISYVIFPEPIWFFPWFVAAMLFLAGITNICPMVMMFQFLGFR